MARISPLYIVPPVFFAALSLMFFVGMNRDNPEDLPSTRIGLEAPALKVTPLGDFPLLTDAMLREPGVKLLNFWASWCVGCRLEHPVLMKMAERGGRIYGVDYKDDRGLEYLTGKGNPYVTVSQDRDSRTAIEWGVYGIPETFVIDANGIVTHRHIGAITQEVMDDIIMPEMEKAARSG